MRKLTIWQGTHKRCYTPPRTKPDPSGDPFAMLAQIISGQSSATAHREFIGVEGASRGSAYDAAVSGPPSFAIRSSQMMRVNSCNSMIRSVIQSSSSSLIL